MQDSLFYLSWGRILSVIVALIILVVAGFAADFGTVLAVAILDLFAVSCIWFKDEIGGFTGHMKVLITSPTPGVFIRVVGWFLLLSPILLAVVFSLSGLK